MKWLRLLPIGLVFVCLPLIAAPAERDVSASEARQLGRGRQNDALRHAKRAQRDAKKRQNQVAREIKNRDRQRRHETEQLTKSRRRQGKQAEAHAGQADKPAPPSSRGGGPNKDQPSPIELLRGYSGAEPKQ